ncbi:hypothetical protein [Pseudomonas coronafaciens]|uniref:hypothetical protein n=1 Tax=Pseudomonas coronafaciens TaxID=53409 RepID=UPI0006B627ED|nr:hypothetical protein [Pseudomonas coronafaciens]
MTNAQKAQLLRYFADELAFTPEDPIDVHAEARAKLRLMLQVCLEGTVGEQYNLMLGRHLLSPRISFDREVFERLITCIETGYCDQSAGFEEVLGYHRRDIGLSNY